MSQALQRLAEGRFETDRLIAMERARDAHRQPQADPQPSAEKKPKPKLAPAKTTASKQQPSQPPPPSRVVPSVSGEAMLPPGAQILSAGEVEAVDHLLAWYEAVQARGKEGI